VIDLARALKYPFSGQHMISISVIGGILTVMWPLGLITLFPLLGYQLRIIKDVIAGRDDELPEWNRMGDDFAGGLMVFSGTLIYYLPAIILAVVGTIVAVGAVSGLNLYEWFLYHNGPEIDRGDVALAVICYALALIWMLLNAPFVMAATARYAETREFSAFWEVGARVSEVWAQRGTAGVLMLNLFVVGVFWHVVIATLTFVLPMTCLFNGYLQFLYFAVVWHLTGQWGLALKEHRRKTVIKPLR
jgi:hypothetical protein